MILDPTVGVRWAMAMYGWNSVGMWNGSMVWCADVWMAKIVPTDSLLVCLLHEVGLWMSL